MRPSPLLFPQTTVYSGKARPFANFASDAVFGSSAGEKRCARTFDFFSLSIVLSTFYRFPCCCCCLPACGGPALFGISPLVADRFLFRPALRQAGAVVPVRPYGGSGLLRSIGPEADRERSPGSRLFGRCR